MAYNQTWNSSFEASPADSDDASEGATRIRNLKEAIRERIAHDHYFDTGGTDADHGEHKFVTLRVGAYGGSGESDKGVVKAKDVSSKAELFYHDEDDNEVQITGGGAPLTFPSGTKMLFKNSSAPTGWTFASEDNDRVLLNTSTEADGGSTGGSWTISSLSVDNHSLSESELPNITGSFDVRMFAGGTRLIRNASGAFGWNGGGGSGTDTDIEAGSVDRGLDQLTFSIGGGGSHNHNLSIGSSWRPSYVKCITCTKD